MEARAKEFILALGNHQGRTSGASTVLPIWVNGILRPVRVGVIRGKAELLLGILIVKKLGALVCLEAIDAMLDRANGK